MKKPISVRVAKLIEDPQKAKLLIEYLNYCNKREKEIILVVEPNNTLGIYRIKGKAVMNTDNKTIGSIDEHGEITYLDAPILLEPELNWFQKIMRNFFAMFKLSRN